MLILYFIYYNFIDVIDITVYSFNEIVVNKISLFFRKEKEMTVTITNYSGQEIKIVNQNDSNDYIVLKPDAVGSLKSTLDNVFGKIYNSQEVLIGHKNPPYFSNGYKNYVVYQTTPLTDTAISDGGAGVTYDDRYVVKGGIATPLTATSFDLYSFVQFVNDPAVKLSDYSTSSTSSNSTSSSSTSSNSPDSEDSSYIWIMIVLFVIIVVVVIGVIVVVVYKKKYMM